MVFVLDTTGSMSGLLSGAKSKIWSIANNLAQIQPAGVLCLGLVGFRDRGDKYVVQSFDLSADLDLLFGYLGDFVAQGGGDRLEDVDAALAAALELQWRHNQQVIKIIFLVGDAPPHMDYPDQVQYPELCAEAVKRGILINTIQCGDDPETSEVWREIAQMGCGEYFQIPADGGVKVVKTPLDIELQRLSMELALTVVPYGPKIVHIRTTSKVTNAITCDPSIASDRLAFTARRHKVILGERDLVEIFQSDPAALKDLRRDWLPVPLQYLAKDLLRTHLASQSVKRRELLRMVQSLQVKRQAFLRTAHETAPAHGFDRAVLEALCRQVQCKGITI